MRRELRKKRAVAIILCEGREVIKKRKGRACLKNRKRRLFTQKGPLSASKILANRKIALRFFP